jgi:lipopolysaccharide/colanic/teichoic acid biosynthesis glycosyltransferase
VPAASRRWDDPLKRLLDVTVAGAALLVGAPVLAGVALAVRTRLGAPVLFRQRRTGRGGAPFTLLKFRTMRPAPPGAWDPSTDATRLTPLGRALRRWSLDELPQLWNVLAGDMSLVGPRPLPMEYLPRYSARQARRLAVTPGITGWAQVNGRNATDWPERFELDVWYVEHRSLALDLRILARTAWQVVAGRGVTQSGEATMREFTGA